MRAWAALALLALMLAVPLAAAQDEPGTFTLAAGTYRAFPVDARDGSRFEFDVGSDQAIDVLLVNGTDDAYFAGTGGTQVLVSLLNRTQASADGTFPSAGRWTLIVDNSAQPAGGANGSVDATITASIDFRHVVATDPGTTVPTPVQGGSRNPWPVLMLTSPYWDLGAIGLGGMALWFLILAALVVVRFDAGWDKLGVLVGGVALLVMLWTFLPHPGPVSKVGLPLLIATGVTWLAFRSTHDGRQGARLAFLGAGLGALLGVVIGHLVQALWSDPGVLVVGADRFDDPVFILPVTAALATLLVAVISAFVEAAEDEQAPAAAPAPGLGESFQVTCLRCHTPVKVDRSMKRFRVATDRYEFACPNCHAWMEWAEPKGAAAA